MAYRKLGRASSEKRNALMINQVIDVIMHESIETTEARAKEIRKFVDRAITYGKKGTVEARRDCVAMLRNNKVAATKAFKELAPRYAERNGGYTRIIKLRQRRGDDALMVKLELV
jgi:large subunit ribosomal protein L17